MRIDLNTASVAELNVLPAIGPGLAERIVADREQRGPFESVDSLARVSGIGKATIERLRPFAVAKPPQK
jgi:competence protein ComEA